MDSELFHRLKYKITQTAPAIFADNLMMLIMGEHDIPWNMTFSNEDIQKEFFDTNGDNILLLIEDNFVTECDIHKICPLIWKFNEETLSKHLYVLKKEFCEISGEDVKTDFLFHCVLMIYVAADYYKKGVTSALTIVFFEIYFLACYYLKRMNYKCDLISASTES